MSSASLCPYIFKIKSFSCAEDALNELCLAGLQDFYTIEDTENGGTSIIGCLDEKKLPRTFRHIESFKKKPFEEIDWEKQWELYSPNFFDGQAHIDLTRYQANDKNFKLCPGKGFGDLSHPTTRLMLKLLSNNVSDKTVIDIGCGSGVLSIAAAKMGAKVVFGIDIDQQAVRHAKNNTSINNLEAQVFISDRLPEKNSFKNPTIILMNMIFSEQKIAWEQNQWILPFAEKLIVSGILAEQREEYFEKAKKWGWDHLEKLEQEEGWLGVIFSNTQPWKF